jgi:hypothetical protein
MKNIFTNSELAHTYANQSQQRGRTSSGSFYFEGKTIYSYGQHFPIANIVTNDKGEEVMLFTYRNYSNTTSKHISIVRNATRQYKKIYCHTPKGNHSTNFDNWLKLGEQQAEKLKKAKKPELYLNELNRLNSEVSEYTQFFSLEIPTRLKAVLSIKDKNEYLEYESKAIELAKIEQAKKIKEQKIKFKEEIKKWFNCETTRVYNNYKYDFLRIKENRIETTQAVQIPLELGKRLYQSIKNQSLKVGDKVLNYSVNEIGKEIKIGCHTFKQSYLLKFGSQLINN